MPQIVLATLNARYTHASLGLRYLRANMGALQEETVIREFIIGMQTREVVEKLLADAPRIIGFGVYIWNVDETTRIIALLKRIAPQVKIIVGGPEVSFEVDQQRICSLADFVVTGWGDVTFAKLCGQILNGPQPLMKVRAGEQPPLDQIALPYGEYTDEDVAQRTLYVEASRGCPFKCEFCLSALDKTAWPFELAPFMTELKALYDRGARQFKFVDRTFNLKIPTSLAILDFFLQRMRPDDPCFAHFEVIPDHLPDALKDAIQKFPPGTLQFEIGIQTLNVQVQKHVSRRQDNAKALANIRWLAEHSNAHLHVDLIAGLPGEDLASFAAGFDTLWAAKPHEIQFGILKRLRGAPIDRHTQAFDMRYSPDAPYEIVSTSVMDFATLQRLQRFARYWDLVANSGRFTHTLPLVLGAQADSCFGSFLAFADWVYASTGKTHQIALEKLFDLVHAWLSTQDLQAAQIDAAIQADYLATGAKGRLASMPRGASVNCSLEATSQNKATPARQARHAA
jgi:radical SAM superfamily enzyme YgiQ (UPF0313 family)